MGKLLVVDEGATQSWVPVDLVANMVGEVQLFASVTPFTSMQIVDLLIQPACGGRVLSITHPSPTPWNTIMRYAGDYLTRRYGRQIQYTACAEWLQSLKSLADTPLANSLYPALPLVDFLRVNNSIPLSESYEAMGTPILGTREISKVSRVFHGIPELTRENVELWIKYWESQGMFDGRRSVRQLKSRL